MEQAKIYINELANSLTKITLEEFFKQVHSKFYSDKDISFMEYFLEITEHENEFYIPHKKLIEFGIMTSDKICDIKKKLDIFKMQNGVDFNMRHMSHIGKNTKTYTYEIYYLTPESFKKCLIRAKRYVNQPVDPEIYADYYLLLEKIFRLYTEYEKLYKDKLLSMKEDKIDEQSKKIDKLIEQNNKLLGYSEYITIQNKNIQQEITTVKEQNIELKSEVQVVSSILDEKY